MKPAHGGFYYLFIIDKIQYSFYWFIANNLW
jgi:hypothetical protein